MAQTKEEQKLYREEWQKANPDKVKASKLKWGKTNPDKVRASDLRKTEKLPDYLVKKRLMVQGFPKEAITPELIELKRITIKTTRLCRQLKV